jgi:peptide/nickel transport system permease protein
LGAFLIRRILQSIVTLFIISIVTFALINAAPGGPGILLDPNLSPEDRERMAQSLGLGDPLPIQYFKWGGNLLQGDLGQSIMQRSPVLDVIGDRLPATVELAGIGLLLAIVVGIPLGLLAAMRANSFWDRLIQVIATLGVSIPGFWFAILLIIVFAVQLNWLPSAGRQTVGVSSLADRASHLVLPALVIALYSLAQLTYYTRSSMLEVLRADYIRTARTKGLREPVIMYRHALKNGLIPVVTMVGLMLPRLIGGAVITETVFGWPGIGRLAADAAFQRDYPLIMGITMIVSVVVIVSNLLTDIAYSLIDPRIRLVE